MVEKFAKKAEDIIVEKMTSRDKMETDRERRHRKVTGVFDLIRYILIGISLIVCWKGIGCC